MMVCFLIDQTFFCIENFNYDLFELNQISQEIWNELINSQRWG